MGTRQFAVRRRDGSVRAMVTVSAEDWDRVKQYRWSLTGAGYVMRNKYFPGDTKDRRKRQAVYLHRFILGLGSDCPLDVDHKDGNRLMNTRDNLRVVTHQQNVTNQSGWKNATSPYRGVCWDKATRKWVAQVTLHYKKYHLGSFDDELEAADAAAEFRAVHMPYSKEGAL